MAMARRREREEGRCEEKEEGRGGGERGEGMRGEVDSFASRKVCWTNL